MTLSEFEQKLNVRDKLILNIGCTTGSVDLANAFSKQNTYTTPCYYVESNAALYFKIYEDNTNGKLSAEIKVQEQKDRYTTLKELTPYILRELVKGISVEAPDKSSGKWKQKAHIEYTLLGYIPVMN